MATRTRLAVTLYVHRLSFLYSCYRSRRLWQTHYPYPWRRINMRKHWWNDTDVGIKEYPRTTLSTTNPIRTALRLNLGLRDEKPRGPTARAMARRAYHWILSYLLHVCTFEQARRYLHQSAHGSHTQTKGDNVKSNRHTTAHDGCLDRFTYQSIRRRGRGGETAPSEKKNTASTHLQQKKLKTANNTEKLKAHELVHGPTSR